MIYVCLAARKTDKIKRLKIRNRNRLGVKLVEQSQESNRERKKEGGMSKYGLQIRVKPSSSAQSSRSSANRPPRPPPSAFLDDDDDDVERDISRQAFKNKSNKDVSSLPLIL